MNEEQFDRGRFEEAIETLKRSQMETREELRMIHAELIEMKMAFVSAKAGWKVMLTIGGSVAGIAGYFLEDFLRLIRTIKG
jgi:2-keto-4-pentenoate hydratase